MSKTEDMFDEDKTYHSRLYLGDAVYVCREGNDVILTTENGLAVLDTIVLEPAVARALLDYLKGVFNV